MSNTADRVYTITKDQLPHGWSWATISNLVGKKGVFVDGDWVESKDQDPDGDVRLIQLADIGDGEYRNKSARFLTYLNELDPDKATLFIALMRDQRAQRCLVHSTLAFPSAITPDNAEQLLEEMRLSVAAEVRAEAEKREAELNRKHEDGLTTLVKSHQEEVLDRETKLLALRGEFADHKTAATGEIEKRTNEISSLSQRLRDIEKSVEKNIDSRIQRAASRACREIWFLRLALVMLYLVIVGCAYWFIPSKDEYRIYTLVATVVIAMIGSGFISQIAYEKLARPIWLRRLVSLCDELDVSEHLRRYEVDSVKMRVTKATTQ